MRALAVLPELTRRHDLLILAGGDAYNALAPHYPVVRIPNIRFKYTRTGALSNYLTIKHNAGAIMDMRVGGPAVELIADQMKQFDAQVVVTDSEGYTHAAARMLNLPRISFDHFGVLVYGRLKLTGFDRVRCWGNSVIYRSLYGTPDRVIVSSFFDAPARRHGVRVVGPIMRDAVQQVEPSWGDHLLVYLSNGEHEFIPALEQALQGLDLPVRVYGAPKTGRDGHIEYKPIANRPFLEDLASCRAVVSTTGNQLLGEITYFQKPVLGMPVECLEQRLNAMQIDAMGIGRSIKRTRISTAIINDFLSREHQYRAAFKQRAVSAADEAVEAIEQFARELVGKETSTAHNGRAEPRDGSGRARECDAA